MLASIETMLGDPKWGTALAELRAKLGADALFTPSQVVLGERAILEADARLAEVRARVAAALYALRHERGRAFNHFRNVLEQCQRMQEVANLLTSGEAPVFSATVARLIAKNLDPSMPE